MLGATHRIIEFIEYKGISKYKFYKETNLSNGFLDKNRNIGTDKCEIISNHYPDLNIEWVITGKGSMLRDGDTKETNPFTVENPTPDIPLDRTDKMLDRIVSLAAENSILKAENLTLRQENDLYKKQKEYKNCISPDIAAEPNSNQ